MGDLSIFYQSRGNQADNVRWDSEADTRRLANSRLNRRVHANQFTLGIQQRPARIARIDSGIGLDDQRDAIGSCCARLCSTAEGTPNRADNAVRHAAAEAERIADGDGAFTDTYFVGIPYRHRDEFRLGRVELDNRQVAVNVDPHDLSLED